MRNPAPFAAVCLAAFALGGCLHTKFVNNKLSGGSREQHKTAHYMGGFGQSTFVPSCKAAKSIKVGSTFGDVMLTLVTIGIYDPRTYEVECGG